MAFQVLLVRCGRFLVLSLDRVNVAEVVVGLHVIGSDHQRALEVLEGLLGETTVAEVSTEVPVTDRAVRLGVDRVSPECVGVAPDLGLLEREPGESDARHEARHRERPHETRTERAGRGFARKDAGGAAEEQRERDRGQIAVSVVGQLVPRVDEADDRPEGDHVTRPGREPSRPAPTEGDGGHRDQRHGERREQEARRERVDLRGKLVEG